jgi:hypothetical protein
MQHVPRIKANGAEMALNSPPFLFDERNASLFIPLNSYLRYA